MSPQSNSTAPPVVQSASPYDDRAYRDALGIVVDGYRSVLGSFNMAKRRGVIPRGRLLSEMLTSGSWTPPPLLNGERFGDFCRIINQYLPEDILPTIWYMLEHGCKEPRLIPALKVDRDTGHVVVFLTH